MVDQNDRHRPSLQQTIQTLETLLKEVAEDSTPIQSRLTQSKSLLKSKALERSRLKRMNTVIGGGENEVSREKNNVHS